MAFTMDTLGYAKRLRTAGIPADQAEAHAEAARDFVMADLVTREDMRDALERQTLRLTVRLGGMIAVGVAVLATLIRLGV